MTESFPNAPLIELGATLRWGDSGADGDSDQNAFLRALSRELAKRGYSQSERLVPEGFEVEPGQPQYRYTSPDDKENTVIFQAAVGAFAINAIPPYKTWNDFEPAIELGIDALFAALGGNVGSKSLDYIGLNYVDAFDSSFTGVDRVKFVREALGIDLIIPAAYASRFPDAIPENMFVSFDGVDDDGVETRVKAGLASVANSPRVILDTTVIASGDLAFEIREIHATLSRLHQVIHDAFMAISEPFIDVLRSTPNE